MRIALLLASFAFGPQPASAGWWDYLRDSIVSSEGGGEPRDVKPEASPVPTNTQPETYTGTGLTPPMAAPEESAALAPKNCGASSCVNLPKLPVPDFKKFPQGPERSTAFLDYFGPQAVALQKATGYPASLMLAQWAQESGWGSSANFRGLNSIAGHRCWKKGTVNTLNIAIPGMEKKIRMTCQLGIGSGILYWKFDNALDSTLDYIHNLLYNEETAKAYQSIRTEVSRGKENGVQWRKLMPGLRSYCPWDSYQTEVPSVLKRNQLEEWEGKKLCSCS